MTDTTATEPEVRPAVEAPARACPECGAAVAPDQGWCLECGAAQAPNAASRPPWRSLAAVLGATGVLVAGASAAAYAGLSHQSRRVPPPTVMASVPAPAPAATAPPAPTPPAPAAPATTPPPTATAPPTPAPAATTPPAAPAPTTTTHSSRPATTTPTHHSTPGGTHHGGTHTPPAPKLVIASSGAVASSYDPYGLNPQPDPAPDLLDDDPSPAWGASLPDTSPTGVGIDVQIQPAAIRKIVVQTSTIGMRFDVLGYNGAGQPPSDPTSDAWDNLALGKTATSSRTSVTMDNVKPERYILIFIFEPPPGAHGVKISELKLYR